MAFTETGLAWLAAKRKAINSRSVTYRRPSTGAAITVSAAVGQTQLVNLNNLGVGPDILDTASLSAEATNRDYIVGYADLAAIWPPESGDLIDDENDESGVTNRYQVMALPGQNPWRWFRGGYQKSARIHTKFLSEYTPLWSDAFTDSNGVSLASHAADYPDGGSYVGGTGGIEIQSNRIVASDPAAYKYFSVGESDVAAGVDFCLNATALDLAEMYAEMGVGVRCNDSGAGLRDGYYCTLRVGYTAGEQVTRTLKIISRVSGSSTTVASVTTPSALSLTATYRLLAEAVGSRLVFSLFDSTGEVAVASVDYDSAVLTSYESAAVYFDHHASLDVSLPYLDNLTVENG